MIVHFHDFINFIGLENMLH